MDTKQPIETTVAHHDRTEHNKANINRIRRIVGQLNSLERKLEADELTCEERVIRARTIEKAVASLISNLIECHIDNTIQHKMQDNPEEAVAEIKSLLNLANKYR